MCQCAAVVRSAPGALFASGVFILSGQWSYAGVFKVLAMAHMESGEAKEQWLVKIFNKYWATPAVC